jgi:phospholipid/cholesterol/gamma-HCH transport system ATP-binding protein
VGGGLDEPEAAEIRDDILMSEPSLTEPSLTELSMSEPPLIELHDVHKSFGNKSILNGIDLTIREGETIAVIGPSGTGKSTILRLIAGLLLPDRGQIRISGKTRRGLVEDEADPFRISLVFQQAALFDSLTVGENIGFLLYQHSKLSRHRIQELVDLCLERVGLPGISHLYPAQLSGGMRKRVSLARAIIEDPNNPEDDPELILYDEPTAGLDPVASTIIEDLIRYLHDTVQCCKTHIVVTHQDSTIRRTADRVIMLYGGKVVWQGPVQGYPTAPGRKTNPSTSSGVLPVLRDAA